MKETTFVVKKLIVDFEDMDNMQKEELHELLELNDQELFDLVFKNKKLFSEKFPKLKNLLIK
jgi:succinate dehydrogenase flavin-adding protein (antitoxin of CptAB toxin-antitoxin module)